MKNTDKKSSVLEFIAALFMLNGVALFILFVLKMGNIPPPIKFTSWIYVFGNPKIGNIPISITFAFLSLMLSYFFLILSVDDNSFDNIK